ncbi:unnamed protein product [Brassica napus]|uniref:(rape) hypothetical protein n=1 Tax=Brassica napus TaxID=3708 RepID=A0A816JF11_BRANA|nr:unnamed protein product [Brassica napus]
MVPLLEHLLEFFCHPNKFDLQCLLMYPGFPYRLAPEVLSYLVPFLS